MNTKTHKTFFLLALLLAASLVAGKILVSKYAEGPRQTLPKQAETAQIESQVDQTQPTPASTPTPQPTPEPQAGTYVNTKHGFKFDYPKELGELGGWSSETDYFEFMFEHGWFGVHVVDEEARSSNTGYYNNVDKMVNMKPGEMIREEVHSNFLSIDTKLRNLNKRFPGITFYSKNFVQSAENSFLYFMVIKRDDLYYTLSMSSPAKEINEEELEFFDKIVDSFEFIETTSEETLN